MSTLHDAAQLHEQSRAEMRAACADVASTYSAQIDATADAERRWAQDVDRDDLAEAARAARAALKEARSAFDRKRGAELGAHTKRVDAALADLRQE